MPNMPVGDSIFWHHGGIQVTISNYLKLIFGSLQPVYPFIQGEFDCQQLTVSDVVVPLRRGQFLGEESTWMEDWWITLPLR